MTLKRYLSVIIVVIATHLCCKPAYAVSVAKSAELKGLTVVGPSESEPFIVEVGDVEAPSGLEGNIIAMWQSHGWYFEPKLNRWEWQRARIFQTVEDLYTQSYVLPFLMPMLENAGAYVMSPRERDTNSIEIIVDNDGGLAQGTYREQNSTKLWEETGNKGFGYTHRVLKNGDNPFRDGTARMVETVNDASTSASTAQWSADIPKADDYAVYVSYQTLDNSAPDALYTINTAAGPRQFKVNQKMGGGTWIYLGHFPLDKGQRTVVELSNFSSKNGAVVTADAIKIGGGMGNVARIVKEPLDDIDYEYVVSGYPRFTEGARYWMQWAGVPDSVYTPSNNVNDYTDDYKCRGAWVNYLAGGSSMLPDREGLNIPVDLSFAFHTDAGTTKNDSIIGTLGIYYSRRGKKYENGTHRKASGVFVDMVMTEIVNDIRALYEPKWTRRQMWDKSYSEANLPEVPSMLLELLSHQNFADMKYGLDPTFRFTVSRSIYKGMLRFIAARDGREFVVQPLPVNSMAITAKGSNDYQLSWSPTVDKLEETAVPTSYIVEERIGDGAFRQVAVVDSPTWTTTVNDTDIHSYRVIAVNDGGKSFPSEVLALCNANSDKRPVLVVNGFTRVSAPDSFDSGEIAGFYDSRDHGVPYLEDISYIGSMFEFRRDIPWMDDDAAGFGASRAQYETKVVAGNTFDYVITHGKAIVEAGYPFISTSLDAYITNGADSCQVVDLILGKQKEIIVGRGAFGSKFKTFPAGLQQRLTEHANHGGDIFVSGAFIATDLWDNEFSSKEIMNADQEFAANVLGYKWRVGQASVTGEAYQVGSRFGLGRGEYKFSNTLNEDCYVVESPDSFYPADDKTGATFMRYSENNLIAGTAMDNGIHKAVCIGFPFETIVNDKSRVDLMRQVLNFFAKPNADKQTNQSEK